MPEAVAIKEIPKKPLNPEPIFDSLPEKPEPLFVVWKYNPKVENNNAPICFQYPPDDIEAKKALAGEALAKSNVELQMKEKFILEGINSVPIAVVRAIQSHPASAAVLEYKVMMGSIEILDVDYADIEGVSSDAASSVHYTPIKAIKIVNGCFDLNALKIWRLREVAPTRKEVLKAIDRRIAMINEELDQRMKSQQSNYLDN